MIKAVEENENYDNKIVMRIQFILEVCVYRHILQKNLKWTGVTCLEVMFPYLDVDYYL